jgi:dynein heavy chain
MDGLIEVVRSDINRLQRCTLEALVVLEVHSRDVIKSELLDRNIQSPNEFAWLK